MDSGSGGRLIAARDERLTLLPATVRFSDASRAVSSTRRARVAGRFAELYVADSASQTRRLGELHHAIDTGLIAADADVTELGQVIAGLKPGRRSPDQITIADLTGTGVQDTAIATLARDRARAANAGTIFES